LDALPDTMLIFGQDGCLQEYKKTPDFEAIFPTENKAIGMNITEMLLPEEVARTYLHCIGQTLATGKLQLYEYTLHIRGVKRYREVRFTRISADSVLALLRDITEMRLSQEQVKFLRRHDSMTGVYDRTYFEREVSRAGDRNIGGTAVVMCDVDGLKLINDTLGHAAGDDVLRVVASALSKTFTAGQDIVARIGGDEFAVITYRMDKASIEAAIDQFMGMITYYSLSNPQLPVSVSVGWAADFGDGADIDALLKEADNAMYRQKMHQSQSMRNAIVQTMMKALEARDYITEGHADRLQALVERIGKDLRLSGARLADLLLFAQFHDIGKVGIPDHILNKPGKLTDEEFAMMKQHSDIGYRIALASPDLAPIAGLILRHHEWWNGNGYPLGLKGNEIPLECRILALADAYDAMTSDRPYRKAWTQEAALSEILRCRGSQFDPNLADLFVGLISGGNCPKREQNFRQTKKR
jgi:diguanylate cyclase (GGDEF)-like protein